MSSAKQMGNMACPGAGATGPPLLACLHHRTRSRVRHADLSDIEATLPCRREGDYVQQQRVAMKLSKMAGANAGPQYLWWAVTSLLLQARAAAAGALSLDTANQAAWAWV